MTDLSCTTARPTASFVAEVSSNHNADLKRCLEFIKVADQIGCSGVKFQLFRIKELFAPEILAASRMHRQREAWELPLDFIPELAQQCQASRLTFACTPFYLKAVEVLYPYVDFYKIASYELLWTDLLRECAQTGKPVILSTGMANLEEIDQAVETLTAAGAKDLTLLHCISGYPTPVQDCNLAVIETLRQRFQCPAGWSDHSVNPGVIHRAVHAWGARMIEFHLDLDGTGAEYPAGHCWLPGEMESVIQSVETGFRADGSGCKQPSSSELPDREWRADPSDGLRPLLSTRETFKANHK